MRKIKIIFFNLFNLKSQINITSRNFCRYGERMTASHPERNSDLDRVSHHLNILLPGEYLERISYHIFELND